jgi:hypothetical protein
MLKDIIGKELKVDDYVCRNGGVYKILKLCPKKLSCVKIYGYGRSPTTFYPKECSLLQEVDVILWLLTLKPVK